MIVYLDDIAVFSKNVAEHILHVRQVLQWLRSAGLQAKLLKCSFSTTKIEFLGYMVSTKGIDIDRSRVATITEWPVPKTLKQLWAFLGFINLY